jgi:hypothetical protein
LAYLENGRVGRTINLNTFCFKMGKILHTFEMLIAASGEEITRTKDFE